jgi:hypothetical protein
MFHKIIEIEPLPKLKLRARFDSGDERYYDINPLLDRWPVFRTLASIPGLYELVHIEAAGYGIAWNAEIDLSSEEIWHNGYPSSDSLH